MEEIVNRVAKSPLISINLDEFLHKGETVLFDLKDVLFKGLILREKDFRDFIKTNDWSIYEGKNVGLICSLEAIVPIWAYMLLSSALNDFANIVVYGGREEVEKERINEAIKNCMVSHDFDGGKVVIKGCGNLQNKEYAYTQVVNKLLPKVSSLMYGEPCSTVPIFKRRSK